jgi:hypothetical protein
VHVVHAVEAVVAIALVTVDVYGAGLDVLLLLAAVLMAVVSDRRKA